MLRKMLMTKLLAAALATGAFAHTAAADRALNRGDAVVTGFSGITLAFPSPDDAMDGTFIDLDGAAMRILPLEAGAPPAGQLLSNPSRLDVKARDVGQVFATALDDGLMPDPLAAAPNIYLGATSAYGLQIVIPDDKVENTKRITKGHHNADWMQGQFGPGGQPGSIWKIDGRSRTASLFATIPDNSGPGLGNIAFDPASRNLYVSDLDTGLIYRVDMAGNLVDTFDHGVAARTGAGLAPVPDDGAKADIKSVKFNSLDPSTWGFTNPQRRVWGLAVNGGRLYYAVASGPEVWSVALSLTGEFGSDARREFEVSGTPANHPISSIAFDGKGLMFVAQRGEVRGSYDYKAFTDGKPSVVFRYRREIPDDPATPGTWVAIPDEIAIGVAPDHRSTAGGVALGYGYDETGRMRMGACGGMLWSTGDRLRNRDDKIDNAATVDGLQGSNRTLVRPDNEPPNAAYFVDYDESDSAETVGHLGGVAIWQPCANLAGVDPQSYAGSPEMPPWYDAPGGIPPVGVPPVGWPTWNYNLRLDKQALPAACAPGGLGFLCTYAVRVTNTGPDPYIGAVTLEDHLPAAPAGATMSFDNQPPWTCLPLSPTLHQCTHDPLILWPGTSVDLKVTVDTPAPAPVCSLANTARLKWPWGLSDNNPGDDFDLAVAGIPAAHCPPVGGELANLKIDKSWWGGIEPVCKDKVGHFACEFMISLINTGPGTYNGPFEFEEQIPAGTTVEPLSPGFTCSNGAPATCTHDPIVLAANQGTLLSVAVKVPKDMADDLGCKITNTVKIVKAPGGSDQNTDASDDLSQHDAIIPGTLAQCPDLKLSNLKIKTTDATGSKCPVKDGKWECLFKIRVTNFGKLYANTLEFLDHANVPFHPGKTLSIQAPPAWQCSAVLPHLQNCKSDNPGLAAGDSVEFIATVKVPLAPGAACWVKNHASIWKAPGETAQNTFAGDDTSTAQAHFEPVFPLKGQPYCLAPMHAGSNDDLAPPKAGDTNLSITKSAGSSKETATGQNTPFVITVTNTGPGVYNGPIVVRETLPAEPQNASWSAPWTCEGQTMAGQPNDALCSHPGVQLKPNDSITLNLDVEMSNSFIAPSASNVTCGYTNKVAIEEAAGGTPQNTNGADDAATAKVAFASFKKHGQTFCGMDDLTTPPPLPSSQPTCPQGWSSTPISGKCCPPRSKWNGERCSKDEPPAAACKPKSCNRGQVWDAGDCRCIDSKCPNGTVGDYPDCKPIVVPPPKCVQKTCGRDATWDGATCACVAKQCPAGTTGVYPKCNPIACPKGTAGTPPNCRSLPTTCGPGLKGTPPNCSKIVDPPKCPKGDSGRPPNCKKDLPPSCPKGFTGTPPNCKRVSADPPKTCPAGTVGTPPNCRKLPKVCPPGFKGTPPKCKPAEVPNVKPQVKTPASSIQRSSQR